MQPRYPHGCLLDNVTPYLSQRQDAIPQLSREQHQQHHYRRGGGGGSPNPIDDISRSIIHRKRSNSPKTTSSGVRRTLPTSSGYNTDQNLTLQDNRWKNCCESTKEMKQNTVLKTVRL